MPSPSTDIHPARIGLLNDTEIREGEYVLYWMQQSQRAEMNHALEYAVRQANRLKQGVLVGFGLMDDYPEANLRHYTFMMEGLKETQAALTERGIKMVVQKGSPPEVALSLGRRASVIVCDRGYLRHQRQWRRTVAREADCRVVQVESDVVVPLEAVSDKAEYAARTIRPKIHRHLHEFLVGFRKTPVKTSSHNLNLRSMNLSDIDGILRKFTIDRSVPAVTDFYKGGASEARRIFRNFLKKRIRHYADHSNQPQTEDISHMSPYLHFGQISPLYLALQVQSVGDSLQEARDAYIEELIVRRELAMNFACYADSYDSYNCIPQWAQKTLSEHRTDKREYVYTRRQLENAQTHDSYWNAAMREMRYTGFMHNYMRMYWGKKILEWSKTPQQAYRATLAINNKYFLDGRDPNSYTGVAWIYGVHDRAWSERPIFGKIRYMAAAGLERKCDIQAYVRKVDKLVKHA